MSDTERYKRPFFRSLPGAYKILWDVIERECNHAGVWVVDFETAQIYVGKDMPIDQDRALALFNKDEVRVVPIDNGQCWFLPMFIEVNCGGFKLNPKNRVHESIIKILSRYDLIDSDNTILIPNKPLTSPLQGAKYKEKYIDTAKVKASDKDTGADDAEIDRWTQSAIEGNDFLLEDMEMKDKMATGVPWPPGFDRKHWILEHRDLAARYGWKFKDQQAFRHSLLKVMRDGKTKKQDGTGGDKLTRKEQHTNTLVEEHIRKYGGGPTG
jgi:hypothetical protein